MGRQERRRLARNNRIEERKGKILMTPQEVQDMKRKIATDVNNYKVEAMMTCFALANHRLYGHGAKRTLKTLAYIDELMGYIQDGDKTIEDLKKELAEEAKVNIVCN